MAGTSNIAVSTTGGLLSFEKELICSICTEVLYTPLTILNCLHTFCASCLKEWFYHQHRKASSSRSSSAVGNPYSCPTCRSEARDVQHNATVSNLLELFLAANPTRDRTQQDKEEMDEIYKPDGTRPSEKIMPKVERRRDKRNRREDANAAAREAQMVEEARLRSLRDLDSSSSASTLAPPRAEHDRSTRSVSAERDERRQRRRDRERQREQTTLTIPHSIQSDQFQEEEADRLDSLLPVSSPRHPDAVEARHREQRMSHQASLRSLVSASESGAGTGDSLDEARIMQEILDEGLLGEIDVDSLTEAEQDALAERIAELYRQRHPRVTQTSSNQRNHQSPPSRTQEQPSQSRVSTQPEPRRRSSSQSRSATNLVAERDPDTRSRSHSSRPPPVPVNTIGRSNSGSSVTINHRRRTSDQTRQQRTTGSRQSSTERKSASVSATNVTGGRSEGSSSAGNRPTMVGGRTNTDPASSPRVSETWLQVGGEDRRLQSRNGPSPSQSPRYTQTMPVNQQPAELDSTMPQARPDIAELDSTAVDNKTYSTVTQYSEPSITCFRCQKSDIQYDIFRHCQSCVVDLCVTCYREGKGCKHWYGFGHAAEDNWEASKTRDDTTEPPHLLIGRQYRKPTQTSVLNTRLAPRTQENIPSITKSNPGERLQEGHFCDRCGTFANSQFWLCDICNDGEWGFCKQCVQEHHCCTHPLLPVAYIPQSQIQAQTLTNDLANLNLYNPPVALLRPASLSAPQTSRPITPTSATSSTGRPRPHPGYGYDYLSINVNCDMCHNIIFPASPRHHCPFHTTDYDICTSCYASFLAHTRMRRDANNNADIIAGWRKCPAGHRMIVLAFEADDEDGAMRRVVKHDLVGGRKMNEADIKLWNTEHNLLHTATPPTSPPLSSRGTWTWKENSDGSRKTRSRASTLIGANGLPNTAGASSSTSTFSNPRFPPDGGLGGRGVAFYPYWPELGEDGAGELTLPRAAEVTEMEDINGDWWSGVYAGDIGVFPAGYVRDVK